MQWRKSTYSGGANDQHCIELGRLARGGGIGLRDSKNPDGGRLILSIADFAGLIEQVKQHPFR
ncbi:Domain of uncharacterised function (DUF397) [Mycobacterium tuberculosis]|nr:Domain of uncharacterised function (DUF397) [Mycobacterium tuberculosis]